MKQTVQNDSRVSLSNHLCVDPLHSIHCVLHPAVEMNRTHVLRASLLPGVPIPQPVICFFHLWGDRSVGGVTYAEVNRPNLYFSGFNHRVTSISMTFYFRSHVLCSSIFDGEVSDMNKILVYLLFD